MKRLFLCAALAAASAVGCAGGSAGGFDPFGQNGEAVEFFSQAAVFALCPEEARVVEIVNGKTRFSCAGNVTVPSCPAGEVLVGVRVFVQADSGQKRVEPMCAPAAPAENPPATGVAPVQSEVQP